MLILVHYVICPHDLQKYDKQLCSMLLSEFQYIKAVLTSSFLFTGISFTVHIYEMKFHPLQSLICMVSPLMQNLVFMGMTINESLRLQGLLLKKHRKKNLKTLKYRLQNIMLNIQPSIIAKLVIATLLSREGLFKSCISGSSI